MFTRQNRSGRWIARAALAGLAAGALALLGSAPALAYDRDAKAAPDASANNLPAGGAAIGTTGPSTDLTYSMNGQTGAAPIVQITLTYSDGEQRTAYCIDFQHEAERAGSEYDPGAWDQSNVQNLPMIQWILTNSFPNADAASVLSAAGVDTSQFSPTDQQFIAYAGTQTAIWHYSDGVEITGNGDALHGMSDAGYQATQQLRTYLIQHAQNQPQPQSPTLTISPNSASGSKDGAGPFTVATTGSVDKLALSASNGAQIVDKDGNALTSVSNGTKFWVKSDSPAQITVTGTASGTIPTGEVYLAKDGADQYQKLILADTASKQLSSTATVALTTASPSTGGTAGGGGSLPVTGSSLPIIIGSAAALLIAGGVAVFLARRRRVS